MKHNNVKCCIMAAVIASIMLVIPQLSYARDKTMIDNPFDYSQYPEHIQQQIKEFQDTMAKFTSVSKVQEDENYLIKSLLRKKSPERLLETNNLILNANVITLAKSLGIELNEQWAKLELEMKAAVCSAFAGHSIEQVDAMQLVDIVEQIEVKFELAQQNALEKFIKVLQIDELNQLRAVASPTTTEVKTDYRAMAEQEPEFFKSFVHQRCLKQAALGIEASEGNENGKLKSNGTDIEISFVEG